MNTNTIKKYLLVACAASGLYAPVTQPTEIKNTLIATTITAATAAAIYGGAYMRGAYLVNTTRSVFSDVFTSLGYSPESYGYAERFYQSVLLVHDQYHSKELANYPLVSFVKITEDYMNKLYFYSWVLMGTNLSIEINQLYNQLQNIRRMIVSNYAFINERKECAAHKITV